MTDYGYGSFFIACISQILICRRHYIANCSFYFDVIKWKMLIGLTQHHQQNTHGNDMSSWATGENRRFSEGVEGSSHRFDCSCSISAKILRLRWRFAQNDRLGSLYILPVCWFKSISIIYNCEFEIITWWWFPGRPGTFSEPRGWPRCHRRAGSAPRWQGRYGK